MTKCEVNVPEIEARGHSFMTSTKNDQFFDTTTTICKNRFVVSK